MDALVFWLAVAIAVLVTLAIPSRKPCKYEYLPGAPCGECDGCKYNTERFGEP